MTNHDPEQTLRNALRYIGGHYGATLAHHLIALALRTILDDKHPAAALRSI